MKRRNVLALMGALSGGGAIGMGTGAFSSVSAARDVTVEVAGDASAYLEIEGKSPHKDYIHNSNGEFAIDLTSSDEGAKGVNADATTVIADLFEVRNQGTQEVELDLSPMQFVDGKGSDDKSLTVLVVPKTNFPTVTLGVGESETYGLCIDEYSPNGADLQIGDGSIKFYAEATN